MRCILNEKLGLYCPTCGSTRACMALIDGDFVGAFLYNPFLFTVFIPFIVYIGVVCVRRLIMGKWTPSVLSLPNALTVVVAIFVGMWIFRNIFPLRLAE